MSDTSTCVVCHRRTPTRGSVCDPDRRRIANQLSDLPRKIGAATLQLVPGGAPAGPKVSTSRTGSPTGARLDALTLLGPGSDGLSPAALAGMLHPKIRRWRTTHRVTVRVPRDGGVQDEERAIDVWHQEVVRDDASGFPVMVAADDQVGVLPPAEWLDSWVRAWRQQLHHQDPQPARVTAAHRASEDRAVEHARRVVDRAWRRHAIQVVLGLHPGHNGEHAQTRRGADPIADEWEVRWGHPTAPTAPSRDVSYLLATLDTACDTNIGIADFATELRSITAELARVLGEIPDQQRLGRCPTQILDRATGLTRPCGTVLWQDPYATQITCPRCRSTWGSGSVALILLARAIRRAWPIDRRRRYTRQEIEKCRPLHCPACGLLVRVEWKDVTGVGDRHPTWQPVSSICPCDCPVAEGLI